MGSDIIVWAFSIASFNPSASMVSSRLITMFALILNSIIFKFLVYNTVISSAKA
jgi:hypothetical protein